jgi:uncharacterized protein (UPF0276 family)
VPHYPRALAGGLDVDWVEVITENFFGGGGRPRAVLSSVRRELPLVFHGVSLDIGSIAGPTRDYLRELRALCEAFEPAWVSDHLCWSSYRGQFSHDLLPVPHTAEALRTVIDNVGIVQDFLGREILLENVSSYVSFEASEIPEWEFLAEVSRHSGCFILLDLNNILVSAHNHGFAPHEYLDGVPAEKVRQLHLANHTDLGAYKLDDHRGAVPREVWSLFEAALRRLGPVSSLIEWDEDVPSWELLRAEQREAERRAGLVVSRSALPLRETREGAPRVDTPRPLCAAGSNSARAPQPTLEDTQRTFFDAITWPRGAGDFVSQLDERTRAAFDELFSTSAAFDRIQRLEVYANAYFYRLLGALRELFPRLAYLAGEVGFHNLITDYVLACPSRAPDLRRLGDRLPGFVRGHGLSQLHPLLVDVAVFELASSRALDCAAGGRVDAQELARIPHERWPGLRFAFSSPTLRLESAWDLVSVGELCERGQREQALALSPSPQLHTFIVGRRGQAVYFRRTLAAEDKALSLFGAGASFESVCEALVQRDSQFEPAEMVTQLRRWLEDDVLKSFSVD